MAAPLFKKMSIGDRVRHVMDERGIKQTELALRIGVGQAAISNIVTDASRKPSAPTLIAMATELRVNPAWILTGEGDPYTWAPVTSADQVELLNLYRAMTNAARQALLATARTMLQR